MTHEVPQELTPDDLMAPIIISYLLKQRRLPVIAQPTWMGTVEGTLFHLPYQSVPEGASVERSRHGVFEIVTPTRERMTTYALFLPKEQATRFDELVTAAKEAAIKAQMPEPVVDKL